MTAMAPPKDQPFSTTAVRSSVSMIAATSSATAARVMVSKSLSDWPQPLASSAITLKPALTNACVLESQARQLKPQAWISTMALLPSP